MKNPAIKYGILGFIAVGLYYLLVFSLGRETYLNPFVQWAVMLVYVALMWKAITEQRAAWDNKIDFKMALRSAFIVFLFCNLAFYLFDYGANFYDPELLQMKSDQMAGILQEQLDRGVGDPQEANEIRQNIKALKEHADENTLGPVFLRMSIGAIGGFVLAAALATVAKTE